MKRKRKPAYFEPTNELLTAWVEAAEVWRRLRSDPTERRDVERHGQPTMPQCSGMFRPCGQLRAAPRTASAAREAMTRAGIPDFTRNGHPMSVPGRNAAKTAPYGQNHIVY